MDFTSNDLNDHHRTASDLVCPVTRGKARQAMDPVELARLHQEFDDLFGVNAPPAWAEGRPSAKVGFLDPARITDYQRSDCRLEEFLCFAVITAGRTAYTTCKQLNSLLNTTHGRAGLTTFAPFESLRQVPCLDRLASLLKGHGIGCHSQKAAALSGLAHSGLCLRTCTLDDLEAIPFVGPKTARFFLLHSRPDQRLAVLDVHVLRYLGSQGIKAPSSTPPKGPRYRALEGVFLRMADEAGMTPAAFDLHIGLAAQDDGAGERPARRRRDRGLSLPGLSG